jgi:hypothetical protein
VLLSVPDKMLNRIILERIKKMVDTKLRNEQAGLRQNRSCTDQNSHTSIISEQSIEWNSPLNITFVDYEKAFDSLDRETLWKLLRYHGVPEKVTNFIRKTYENMSCRVIYEGQLSKLRQECDRAASYHSFFSC